MKFRVASALAAVLITSLSLTACGGGREGTTSDPAATGSSETAAGFAADATVGVALPWLGTQNWKEAEVLFKDQLKAAGLTPLVQSADQKVPQQQQQIEAMIEQGAKVIVVGPVDGTQLGSVLEKAHDAGIAIIGYDRLIENTTGVDAVVQFGSIRTGELQGQSLLDGLAERAGDAPYNIELFGGGPADPNAPSFFEGAMKVLQPKIDDGTLVVVSGQKDFTQVATQDWDNAKAQARMDSLLSGFYADKTIDGVLSPNDGIGRAILTSVAQAGQELPVVTGLDAENESIISINDGKQYSTVAKPTDALVAKTIELISALQKGEAMPSTDAKENNGSIDVPIFQLDPVVVTKANLKEVFANDPERLKLIEG
ncbi:substrate-binding domain-containing protein [Tessaracoccus antarcticus]|uniref:Sugar ABC transporter substrate-binding protein n=1 Tax=Tessaracoccus antarcticus TaxID=2479848 RepID=A0A3M0GK90_9ACTN|nr:sugar-binding protein [Tessaracoccus antarcticus]RMB62033.1 sugar ABC transporter substrate-binding protein [Tessaracoccus antarcticus]